MVIEDICTDAVSEGICDDILEAVLEHRMRRMQEKLITCFTSWLFWY